MIILDLSPRLLNGELYFTWITHRKYSFKRAILFLLDRDLISNKLLQFPDCGIASDLTREFRPESLASLIYLISNFYLIH